MKKNKSKGKEPARRPKYGTVYCMKWLVTRMWQWDRSLIWSSAALIPLSVLLYAIGLYTPSIILDSIQTNEDFNEIALIITVLLCATLFFNLIKDLISHVRSNASDRNFMRFYWELIKTRLQNDYFLNYDTEYLKLYDRAEQVFGNGMEGSPGTFVIRFFDMAANALCFVLFGSVISTLSPWFLLLFVAGSLVTMIPRRYQQDRDHEERDERNANFRKMNYLSWKLASKPIAAKDIRLYGFTAFLDDKIHTVIREHIRLLRHQQKNRSLASYVSFGVGFLRDGCAYLFLIWHAVHGNLTSAEFVLYFNAIARLSSFIDGIVQYIGSAHEAFLGTSDCIAYFDENHNRMNHAEGIPIPKGRPLSIEFRHVSYQYPKGEQPVLQDISFRIAAGENISLVGLNGAGKTTLAKLMCGLLLPTEGEILIDGHLLGEYNRDELYTLFSMVPQEYTILPTTIAENVAFRDRSEIDEARLLLCLEKAGIADKIRSLPKGIDSMVDKQYDADAVNFSGGELQKLLLARAIYRDADILILDEPTAALDAVAEDRMYQSYRELTNRATSVFISHRLASTRFCDRIYLLDGARLAESGTHEELMALGGRYRELFDIQSKYYKEGGDLHDEKEESSES
ncbi:MAG: ABC transporter ATP-binding protein/permease [Lachnospiraceae bacterium]|nr:ABC transporter ATP-binding protein/permease [Lachnospiraceae bacterium]